jgi:hypothetical protein
VRRLRACGLSATAAIWPDGHVDPDAGVQARRCLAIIEEALTEAGVRGFLDPRWLVEIEADAVSAR